MTADFSPDQIWQDPLMPKGFTSEQGATQGASQGASQGAPRRPKIWRHEMESNIVRHCNLTCKQCSALSPHFKEGYYDPEKFRSDINRVAAVLHTGNFQLLGGEPLLNPALPTYVYALRESGITDKVTLYTNGLLLAKTEPAVLRLFDKINISVYMDVPAQRGALAWVTRNQDWLPPVELREKPRFIKYIRPEKAGVQETLESFRKCWAPPICNTIAGGRYYLCVQSAFTGAVDPRWPRDEGVDLYAEDYAEQLEALIQRFPNEPMRSCSYCNSEGPWEEHQQVPVTNKIWPPGDPMWDPPPPTTPRIPGTPRIPMTPSCR